MKQEYVMKVHLVEPPVALADVHILVVLLLVYERSCDVLWLPSKGKRDGAAASGI